MSTTTLLQTTSSSPETATIMLSPTSELDGGRVVRFDSECVLIPDHSRSKRPRVLTKSYSLPLWKRKAQQTSDSEGGEDVLASPVAEETHVVLKVPIPTFIRKASRSPSRGRSMSMSPPTAKPLSPCLVHRSPSVSAVSHPHHTQSPTRRPSLPIYHRPRDESALTVPLRACCADCEPITEECLKEGDHWQEKFTRGARRRRSASLDNVSSSTGIVPGKFAAVATTSFKGTVEPAVIPTSRYPTSASAFAITVDEVDKRRKSQEFSDIRALSLSSSSSSPPGFHSPSSPYSSGPSYRHARPHDRDFSTGSTSSSASEDQHLPTSPEVGARTKPRSSPIQEEDEAQLFPLPSPRRSPSGSPSPSLNQSPKASPRASPVPSPNTSTSCLGVPVALSGSKDSIVSKSSVVSKNGSGSISSSSSDGRLKGSLSRKETDLPRSGESSSSQSGNGFLHPTSPSKSRSGVNTTPPSSFSRSPAPLFPSSSSPSALSSSLSSPTDPSSARRTKPYGLSLTTSSPVLSSSNLTSSPKPISTKPPSPNTIAAADALLPSPRSAHSPILSPSSPRAIPKQRKLSFTRPFVRATEALKEASVDVLRGVSSMGSGGVSM